MIQPTLLVILDGWGIGPANRANAIRLAQTPVFDRLVATFPTMALQASGESVGLPWGEMGNSEVGHMNIGAGKIVYQDLPRITRSILDGSFFTVPAFQKALAHVQKQKSQLHLAGLVSSGGIHSFHEHLYALLELCARERIERVFIHAFLDGRDTPYNSAKNFCAKLLAVMGKLKVGKLATMCGRYWAMDRDRHWDRVEKAYRAMTEGVAAATTTDPLAALDAAYRDHVFDEEFPPTTVVDAAQQPVATIRENDAVIFFNFRNDRMRQLTQAFVGDRFSGFPRKERLKNLFVVTMTEYEPGLPVAVAFPKERIEFPLARVVSDVGLHQCHIAETEKYAHVTFFLNGGREEPFPNEDRVLIPSPSVATYDQKPEMSARAITDRLLQEVARDMYALFIVNYANADMVGHTGHMPAIIKAVEMIDACLGRVVDAVLERDGTLFCTADHGNAEEAMNLRTGTIDKEHSISPVPFIAVARRWQGRGLLAGQDLAQLTPVGFLADIAPTVLATMGIPQPAAMTGRPLLHVTLSA
ncbi:MAG: 2,3-bisphosphoglycerate-independent phosphoglycerate mutase [bacterium]